MPLVLLKNDWFAPNGVHYAKGRRMVPSAVCGALPKSAKLFKDDAPPPVPAKASGESLRDHDPERAAAEAEAAAEAKAEQERLANRARIEAAIAKEKSGKK